jgi:hypothetical protein
MLGTIGGNRLWCSMDDTVRYEPGDALLISISTLMMKIIIIISSVPSDSTAVLFLTGLSELVSLLIIQYYLFLLSVCTYI